MEYLIDLGKKNTGSDLISKQEVLQERKHPPRLVWGARNSPVNREKI